MRLNGSIEVYGIIGRIVGAIVMLGLLAGCAASVEPRPAVVVASPTPIPRPTRTSTPLPTATLTPTTTSTPAPTNTPTATATPPPTGTASASAVTRTPRPTPTDGPPPPPPPGINGVANAAIFVMSDAAQQHVQAIFAAGQALGRNPRAFSKVGDSTIQLPYFLGRFDGGDYDLGDYAYLQSAIDYYAGSFGRDGEAVRKGFHSWTVFNPTWANKDVCEPNEGPLPCEFRVHNPSVLLIRLGANDVIPAGAFEKDMRAILDYAIENGVIPILGTKPDRNEGSDQNNTVIRQLADEYTLPLWDFDALAATLPDRGLGPDKVHMTSFPSFDYTQPTAFERGHAVHNLSALIVLDRIRLTVGSP